MMQICGIQQMGIGVQNVENAWAWYRRYFGMDVPVFEEEAVANLMLPYTGGQPQNRYAVLAINLQGGGGFEIWQYTKRTPQAPASPLLMGDLGINIAKIKCKDVTTTYAFFVKEKLNLLTPIHKGPDGNDQFYVMDNAGNIFQLVASKNWFLDQGRQTGGIYGAVIGVTDIQKCLPLYQDILGYDHIVSDLTETPEAWAGLPGGGHEFRRVLLRHSKPRKGAFSRLCGDSTIELVQVKDRTPRPVFEGRFWGDLGFIHLCFDIHDMDDLKRRCETSGFQFTVDSQNSFDMGEAAGRFAYIEDPDGTLIEFVETHKIPVLKKLGWYLNLRNRNPEKPLPDWMLRMLGLNRRK